MSRIKTFSPLQNRWLLQAIDDFKTSNSDSRLDWKQIHHWSGVCGPQYQFSYLSSHKAVACNTYLKLNVLIPQLHDFTVTEVKDRYRTFRRRGVFTFSDYIEYQQAADKTAWSKQRLCKDWITLKSKQTTLKLKLNTLESRIPRNVMLDISLVMPEIQFATLFSQDLYDYLGGYMRFGRREFLKYCRALVATTHSTERTRMFQKISGYYKETVEMDMLKLKLKFGEVFDRERAIISQSLKTRGLKPGAKVKPAAIVLRKRQPNTFTTETLNTVRNGDSLNIHDLDDISFTIIYYSISEMNIRNVIQSIRNLISVNVLSCKRNDVNAWTKRFIEEILLQASNKLFVNVNKIDLEAAVSILISEILGHIWNFYRSIK